MQHDSATAADPRALRGLDRLAALARQRGAPAAQKPEFCLLTENLPVLQLWGELQTQWAHGPMGPTGFNWASLRAHPATGQVPRAQRAEVLGGIATMERAWLTERARLREAAHKEQGG
ncbi:DUF1799 domain-containing protein [Paucibacter sp. DJ4R-1]|nr:DUF1799 domain-containing protein [Paucibacter sp. DJ4R-1]